MQLIALHLVVDLVRDDLDPLNRTGHVPGVHDPVPFQIDEDLEHDLLVREPPLLVGHVEDGEERLPADDHEIVGGLPLLLADAQENRSDEGILNHLIIPRKPVIKIKDSRITKIGRKRRPIGVKFKPTPIIGIIANDSAKLMANRSILSIPLTSFVFGKSKKVSI